MWVEICWVIGHNVIRLSLSSDFGSDNLEIITALDVSSVFAVRSSRVVKKRLFCSNPTRLCFKIVFLILIFYIIQKFFSTKVSFLLPSLPLFLQVFCYLQSIRQLVLQVFHYLFCIYLLQLIFLQIERCLCDFLYRL